MYIVKSGKHFWKNIKNMQEFIKYSLKTHQNRSPRALGVLNSESARKMRYGTLLKIENGAGNICFMAETCEKMVCVWCENGKYNVKYNST